MNQVQLLPPDETTQEGPGLEPLSLDTHAYANESWNNEIKARQTYAELSALMLRCPDACDRVQDLLTQSQVTPSLAHLFQSDGFPAEAHRELLQRAGLQTADGRDLSVSIMPEIWLATQLAYFVPNRGLLAAEVASKYQSAAKPDAEMLPLLDQLGMYRAQSLSAADFDTIVFPSASILAVDKRVDFLAQQLRVQGLDSEAEPRQCILLGSTRKLLLPDIDGLLRVAALGGKETAFAGWKGFVQPDKGNNNQLCIDEAKMTRWLLGLKHAQLPLLFNEAGAERHPIQTVTATLADLPQLERAHSFQVTISTVDTLRKWLREDEITGSKFMVVSQEKFTDRQTTEVFLELLRAGKQVDSITGIGFGSGAPQETSLGAYLRELAGKIDVYRRLIEFVSDKN